jgi:IS5 family transposase
MVYFWKISNETRGADADTALVEKVSVTPGNAYDGRNGEAALPDDP